MLVSTPYNQHFFNLPIISKTNTKVSKFMHSNIVDWWMKIINNRAHIADVSENVVCIIDSSFLNLGANPVKMMNAGHKNAKNCKLLPSNVSIQTGINERAIITIII